MSSQVLAEPFKLAVAQVMGRSLLDLPLFPLVLYPVLGRQYQMVTMEYLYWVLAKVLADVGPASHLQRKPSVVLPDLNSLNVMTNYVCSISDLEHAGTFCQMQ